MELAKQTGPIGPVNGNLRVDEDNESRWQSDDIERLRSFPALRSLDEAIFHLVLEHATLESANVGALVHIDGAPREVLAFLLDGAVECNGGTVEALGRETPIAPGQWTATANVRVVKVDLGIANIAAVWLFAQAGDPNLDWIPRFVQSNWFERLPKTAAYRMFVNAERIRTKKGEQLYAKSEPAGHGYVVLNGAVALSTDTGKQQLLPGASFGDEVFNDAPRAADAEMAKTGEILSWPTQMFSAFDAPDVQVVEHASAVSLVEQGAQWLDVRLPSEHGFNGETDSINIPLASIAERLADLSPAQPYIVYCNSGARSAAAAAHLQDAGFTVFVLDGGLFANATKKEDQSEGGLSEANAALELALRAKVEATAERRIWSKEAKEIEESDAISEKDKQRLRAKLKRLELESGNSGRILAEAQRRKLELESELRAEEAKAKKWKAAADEACVGIRAASEKRLEEARESFATATVRVDAELERLTRAREIAEEQFREQQAALEAAYQAEISAIEERVATCDKAVGEAKVRNAKLIDDIKADLAEREAIIHAEADEKVAAERARMESRFSQATEEIQAAKAKLEEIELRRAEAHAEAEEIATQLREASERKRAEMVEHWRSESEVLERDAEDASNRLEVARVAKAEAEAERRALVEQLRALRSKRPNVGELIEAIPASNPATPSDESPEVHSSETLALLDAVTQEDDGELTSSGPNNADLRAETMREAEEELREQLWAETEEWMKQEHERETAEQALADVHERALAAQRDEAARDAERSRRADSNLLSDVKGLLVDEPEPCESDLTPKEMQDRARSHIQRLKGSVATG